MLIWWFLHTELHFVFKFMVCKIVLVILISKGAEWYYLSLIWVYGCQVLLIGHTHSRVNQLISDIIGI